MNEINFTPFPILTTERLTLRQLSGVDDLAIFFLRTDERVNKYIERQKPANLDEAKSFILKINDGIKHNNWIYWAISLRNNPDLIGTICLWNFSRDKTTAEVGYELNPVFHGQGLMNEALRSIIDFGIKTIGLKKIDAYTHKDNSRSTRLLEKNNFTLDLERKDEENLNNIIYSLTELQ
ncbi:MAG: GNAT family N-acetyltransferase [Ignavibacteriales bacterium]|nr:GNAT family N-acetyltransferase [Ignavibacteriales bacterium]